MKSRRRPFVRRGSGSGCSPNRASSPPSSAGNVVCPVSSTSASFSSRSWRGPSRDRRASITSRARSKISGSSPRSRCRSCARSGAGPRRPSWGEWLERFESAGVAGPETARSRASRARRSQSDGRDWPDRPRRSRRSARLAPCEHRGRAAGPALRPGARDDSCRSFGAGVSRSCSCRRLPSGCFRRSRAKIRCCSTMRAR